MGKNMKDITGIRFGKLVAIRKDNAKGKEKWLCICDCGKEKAVDGFYLRTNHTRSCGCLRYESKKSTHGLSKSPLYHIYMTMKARCGNPNNHKYARYGGRGISICNEWTSDFMTFYNWAIINGFKQGLSIDRINLDGNYTPENCKWSTPKEQARNTSTNRNIAFLGKTKCLQEWANEMGIKRETIAMRLNKGWSIGDTFNTPLRGNG